MARPTKDQVLTWKIDTLREIADSVETEKGDAGIEPGINGIRASMRGAIHDLDWSGAARTAATGRADEEWTDIGRIINAYSNIGSYCRAAYRDMSHPIDTLQAAVKTVEGAGGAVSQDWVVTGLGDSEEETNETVRLQGLADDLGRRDARWAPDIAAAVADLRAMAPAEAGTMANIPTRPNADKAPAKSDPTANRAWWDSLTADQREYMIATQPQTVGALDGLPALDRHKANVSILGYTERELQTQLATADTSQAQKVIQGKIDDVKAIRAQVENRSTLPDGTPDRLLMVLDASGGEHVEAAIAIGNPDTATHVSVTVPGLNTNAADSLGGMVSEAEQLRFHSQDLLTNAGRADESVATIAWLGYEPPQNVGVPSITGDPVGLVEGLVGVTSPDRAEVGAGALANFYDGLDASQRASGNENAHITALGHSYGSTTTSLALQQLWSQGKQPVDDVVLYGSPGLGGEMPDHMTPRVGDALVQPKDYGLEYGHVFTMATPDDPVAKINRFGFGPTDTPGWISLETQKTVVDGVEYVGASGHSDYPRSAGEGQTRMTVHNMASVLTGVYSQARVEGFPNLPYKIPEGP
ncbi:alpha/beta hydrolase [Nocardia huaxiensis]|uniref:alpha/beta hydrolase n=1 Tax=Nocardia huaxiensis TaxID=2755382 RepID=UPI001E2F4AA1|nr:alpha/beta hydrolase [Nocardia huaxiensis]UFS99480.1 alpha/beta hydrolase family protein [Nocardia huaxiensis]